MDQPNGLHESAIENQRHKNHDISEDIILLSHHQPNWLNKSHATVS
jgi:hypothetical protein